MIYGIGTDIVAIVRIEEVEKKYVERFPRKILSTEELFEYEGIKNKKERIHFLAKKFAAKEALLKAIGIGLHRGLSLSAITVTHHQNGKPFFKLDKSDSFKQQTIHLSITDEKDYAVAFVVIEEKK